MSLKSRVVQLEQAKRRQSAPVLLWLNDDESEIEARQRAGVHADDPAVIVSWMTAAEAHTPEGA